MRTPRRSRVPYLPIVVGACLIAVAGYAVFSWWAVFVARDATMTGDVIGTWKSFAVLAFGFWLGSSSAGTGRPIRVAQLLLQLLTTIVKHAPCCNLPAADLAANKAADAGGRVLQILLALFGDLQAVGKMQR